MKFLDKLLNRNDIEVKVMYVDGAADLDLPKYKTDGAVGMDLYANVPANEPVTLNVGDIKVIGTGICVELPINVEAQIRARSGNASKYGIALVNGLGTIDYDYRGEIGVILINMGCEPFTIHRGDRIAQVVFNEVKRANWVKVHELSKTRRGTKGYGSTKLSDK